MRTRSLLILGSSGYWGTMGGRGPGATHVNNCLHQQLEPPQLHKTQGEDMKFLSHSPQATFIVDHLSSNIFCLVCVEVLHLAAPYPSPCSVSVVGLVS